MATKRGLLDFGVHGRQAIRHEGPAGRHKRKVREYFTGRYGGLEPLETLGPHTEDRFNSKFSPEQSREATNYIKAVDRQDSGKDWDKDLGGGASFLQGPTGDSSDYVDPLMRMEAKKRLAKGQEASMADFGDEEGGGFWNEVKGLFDSDSIGTPKEEGYRDVDTEGDNRYLNKLAREEFAEKQMDKYDDDLGTAENKLSEDQLRMMGPEYERTPMSAAYLDEGESELDRIGAENRGRTAAMADFKGEEEGQPGRPFGGLRDAVAGMFSSDDEDGGGAEAKRKPLSETQKWGLDMLKDSLSGANDVRPPAIRAPSVIRGQVAFPGLLSKKEKAPPRYSPKGLIA